MSRTKLRCAPCSDSRAKRAQRPGSRRRRFIALPFGGGIPRSWFFHLIAALAVAVLGCDGGSDSVDSPLGPEEERPPLVGFPDLDRFRGVSLATANRLPTVALEELVDTGVEWIALVPFGWQPRFDAPQIQLRTTRGYWTQTDVGIRRIAEIAATAGVRVFLKPHIYLVEEVDDQWRGTIAFRSEEDWLNWEEDYRSFILHYAALAADTGIELLSVGVELREVVRQRPHFWRQLVLDVRQLYRGSLTYGANWDREFEEVEFWDLLDFIGVHAYFPLTGKLNASIEELEQGWQPHVLALEDLARTFGRPVLFTEVGYRSIAGAGVDPWNWRVRRSADGGAEQADAYEAMFRTFWHRSWFAGLFVWEWDPARITVDSRFDTGYSPQNKRAAEIMGRWFTRLTG